MAVGATQLKRRDPPPPPPPPPEVANEAKIVAKKGDKSETPAIKAKRQDELRRGAEEDVRVLPPPGPAAQDQGVQVKERLKAAGVKMIPKKAVAATREPKDPAAPFTGSGATGINIRRGHIPTWDKARLAANKLAQKTIPTESMEAATEGAYKAAYKTEQGAHEFGDQIEAVGSAVARGMKHLPGFEVPGMVLDAAAYGMAEAMRQSGRVMADGFENLGRGMENATDVAYAVQYSIGGETTARYSNPVGDSKEYLKTLSPAQREQQARTLLERPINTLYPAAYGSSRPTRAAVVEAAAKKHGLDPTVLSGFLLAEQRDQSRNEDKKDIAAATSLFRANTSIGLGQMTVATSLANNAEMFSDTLDARTRSRLTHNDAAKLLTSDEHAIFASARYLKKLAVMGDRTPDAKLPETLQVYPGLRRSDLAQGKWNDDQIRAVGSEYTSKPWDDVLIEDWGQFVLEATKDVRRAGVFR